MKYIDADKLIAEIERRQEQLRICCGDPVFSGKEKKDMIVAYEELERLRSIITSLQQEQPEVDLEKEIDREIVKLHTAPCYNELHDFANHFYELGQCNARKEE